METSVNTFISALWGTLKKSATRMVYKMIQTLNIECATLRSRQIISFMCVSSHTLTHSPIWSSLMNFREFSGRRRYWQTSPASFGPITLGMQCTTKSPSLACLLNTIISIWISWTEHIRWWKSRDCPQSMSEISFDHNWS